MKAEMRGHENVIECAIFAPPAAAPAIRELVSQVRSGTKLSSSNDLLNISTGVARQRSVGQDRCTRVVFRCDGLSR